MALNLNKVVLAGHLGAAPDIRYLENGTAVCTISLATNKSWKDKQTGQRQEQTTWHRVVLWGRAAEVVGEYCAKGDPIYLEGELRSRQYDKDGQRQYVYEVHSKVIQLLPKANRSESLETPPQDDAPPYPADGEPMPEDPIPF